MRNLINLTSYNVSIFCFLGMLLWNVNGSAKTYPANVAQISGTDIQASNDDIEHSHMFFGGNLSGCTTGLDPDYEYEEVRNVIKLFVEDGHQRTIYDNFTCTVRCLVEWVDGSCNNQSRTIDLTVSYDTARGEIYQDRHLYTFTDGNYVRVSVVSVSDPQYVKYLTLRSSIEVTCYGKLDPEVIPVDPTVDSSGTDSLIRVNWSLNDLAEEYDLEWVWVDDYDTDGTVLATNQIPYSFRFNSTRVTLDTAGYAFQPIYERGWLLFRYRCVGRSGPDFEHRVLGKWSDYDIAPVGGVYLVSNYPSTSRYHVPEDHRETLNWQYSKTFTERSYKEVATYFDGMLRSRQNVTRIESIDMAVVNEDVYDYAGRKAISVIPTPVFNKRIDFYALFNSVQSGGEYKSDDFDADSGNCHSTAPAMGSSVGASKYYSSSNPYASSPPSGEYWHAYVPQANGYPYSITTYMPDPTNRVREQGGVGPNHQPAGESPHDSMGHTTKYYYGTPSQTELNALFGNDAGYDVHYESKIAVDPQGNANISYLDMKGNVIATALVGDVITGYDALESYTGSVETINIDFNYLPKNVNDANDDDYTLSTSRSVLLPNSSTLFNLTYRMSSDTVAAECLRNVTCNDCVYELYLSVKNQCDEEMLRDSSGNPSPIIRTIGKAEDFTNWCSGDTTAYDISDDLEVDSTLRDPLDIAIFLPRGSYTVTREIRPSESAAEAFARRAIDSSDCLSLDSLLKEEMEKADTLACYIDCESCHARLGDDSIYKARYLANFEDTIGIKDSLIAEAHREYLVMKYHCDRQCKREIEGTCAGLYEAFRMSFSPGGMFAKIAYDSSTNQYSSSDPYSLFNPISDFSYLDSNSPLYDLEIKVGSEYKMIGDLTPHELYLYWQPWLGDSMVSLHPEYCHYEMCQQLIPSERFDAWLEALEDEEYLREQRFMAQIYPSPLLEADSFFREISDPGHDYYPYYFKMSDTILNFISYGGQDYTLFQIAVAAIVCDHSGDLAQCLDSIGSDDDLFCGDRAMAVWHMYRSLYLATKADILRDLVNTTCASQITHYPGVGKIVAIDIRDTLNKLIGLPLTDNMNDFQNWAEGKIGSHCDSICKGYKDWWAIRLGQCDTLANNPTLVQNIIDAMEIVCVSACDENHPYSFNGPSADPNISRFDSVLHAFGIHDLCFGLTIDMPGSENNKYTLDAFPLKNDCPCDSGCKQMKIYIDGVANVIPMASDVDYDGCGCAGGGEQSEYVKLLDMANGRSDGCLTDCYNCSEFSVFVNEFLDSFPTAIDSPQLGQMLSSWLNYHTNLNKTWSQYLLFLENCTDTIIYTDSGQVNEYLNQFEQSSLMSGGGSYSSGVLRGGFSGGFSMLSGGGTSGPGNGGQGIPPLSGNLSDPLIDTCACDSLQGLYKEWKFLNGGLSGYPGSFDTYVANQIPSITQASLLYEFCLRAINRDESNRHMDEFDGYWTGSYKQLQFAAYNQDIHVPRQITCDVPDSNYWWVYFGKPLYVLVRDTTEYYKKKIDSCWIIFPDSTFARVDCRERWLDSLKKALGYIYYRDTTSRPLSHYDSLLIGYKRYGPFFLDSLGIGGGCPDNGQPLGLFSQYIDGQKCTYTGTSYIDTLTDLLNTFIDSGLFYSKKKTLKNIVPWYFTGPLNNPPNEGQTLDHTIARLYELYGGPGANKYTASFQHWRMPIRDTIVGDTSHDKNIDIWIYGSSLPGIVWPMTDKGYIYSFLNPVFDGIRGDTVFIRAYLTYYARGNTDTTPVVITTDIKGLYDANCSYVICAEKYSTSGPNACVKFHKEAAEQRAIWRYDHLRDSLYEGYKRKYLQKCYESIKTNETFTATYLMNRHGITLYYYDQAGNLTQTIPPKGVHKITDADTLDAINVYRKTGGTPIYNNHTMRTKYRYSTLNQVTMQSSPDADTTRFWYDPAGRIILSQNGDQEDTAYSYTLYDPLGRPTEVGRLQKAGVPYSQALFAFETYDAFADTVAAAGNTRREITRTYYDEEQYIIGYAGFTQENLRKRVSSITYQLVEGAAFDHATHYSYDVHGNVKALIQHVPALADIGHNYKILEYEYDLISNNVNKVAYQAGYPDQFYHRYSYDADNRITSVETSSDAIQWDVDALYYYYLHGPLARVELGYKRVQGLDYAYTLHGWLKGVNSSTGLHTYDMGQDGVSDSVNEYVARDAYGYTLNYYTGDYYASNSNAVAFESDYRGTDYSSSISNLYNGNIRHMASSSSKFGERTLGRAFVYDQLNRLIRSKTFLMSSGNTWSGITETTKHREIFRYDDNGNIMSLDRHGDSLQMDDLLYSYYAGNNQLKQVKDSISAGTYANDIDDQATSNNYVYDLRGNIIEDVSEGKTFTWNNAGKLIKVSTEADCGDPAELVFDYDAMGNRLKKAKGDTIDYYIRDAQGNVMAIYKTMPDSIWLISQHVYGSSRLGQRLPDMKLDTGSNWASVPDTGYIGLISGQKEYELTNHLGNVLATVTDRRLQRFDDTLEVDYYEADIVSAQEYYAFGSLMPERQWNLDSDSAIYADTCYTCEVLKDYLLDYYGLGDPDSDSNQVINTMQLTTDLNTEFRKCEDWEYWSDLIRNTCGVWDTMTVFSTPNPIDISGVNYGVYLIGTSNFTVEGWIRLDAGGTATNPTIMSKYHVNPFHFQIGGFKLYVDNNNRIVFLVGDAPPFANSAPNRQASIRTNAAISTGQWYHVVAIKSTNNPNNWNIFINGSIMAKTVTGGALPSGNLESGNPSNLYVGVDNGNANPWHGKLSRVRMLKLAYTFGDVSTAYNSGCGIPQAAHVADLDAPFNTATYKELAQNRTGTPVIGGGGQLTHKIRWVKSGCFTTDTVTWWCEQYLVRAAKSERYGFNGQERDDEVRGSGNSYDYGARMYDSRLGRWFSVDPLSSSFPALSPYTAFDNNPIYYIDKEGKYSSGDKTKPKREFLRVLKLWEVKAKALFEVHNRPFRNSNASVGFQLNLIDNDFREPNQTVKSVGEGDNKIDNFSYNKHLGKYIDVGGFPLDAVHFFKTANIAHMTTEGVAKWASAREEYNQAGAEDPQGRSSAFAPEDMLSNYMGAYFGSTIAGDANLSEEMGVLFSEMQTLFETNGVSGGKYLTEDRVNEMRGMIKKYYDTDDFRDFTKDKSIYQMQNIQTINDNAAKGNLPLVKKSSDDKKD